MRWGAWHMNILLLVCVPKGRRFSKLVWKWPQHQTALWVSKEEAVDSLVLPPTPHLCWAAVRDGGTATTELLFFPKKELPQQLRRTSLTAIIKSWSKSWCPALVHQSPSCCVSEAACASGSSADPGLEEPSLKWILQGKESICQFFPLYFFPHTFHTNNGSFYKLSAIKWGLHCKINVSFKANRFLKVCFLQGKGFLKVFCSCFQRIH